MGSRPILGFVSSDPITVYLLWHMPGDPEKCEDDDALLLGVYSSEENALARIESAREVEGFRDHPDGFQIAPATLDKDEWVERFSTYNP